MDELKVTFYLKKNEERADGTMPILGRIRIGKSMVQFSTKVYAIPELWDVKSGRAVGKSKPATAVNRELDRISVDI
ncbi:MAG: Arm DNA-binding domain-containing protein, partial [Alistipes onderdonkii]